MANYMALLLQSDGVPVNAILREDRSANTYENARFSADLLRRIGASRIALVVEADSMLRAERCFRKQGIAVIPAPCERRTLQRSFREMLPSWSALRQNERSLHEYGGLLWYSVRGWL
jgi:uncharacterized SAM-binding protein YcdF (DUF218 family)